LLPKFDRRFRSLTSDRDAVATQSPSRDGTKNKVHFVTQSPEQSPGWRVASARWDTTGTRSAIGKEYFVRQAAILFGLAKATTDPKISAALLDKAADLKLQVDGAGAPPDLTPIAPDIEPPAR
jgi:hypothetical protein